MRKVRIIVNPEHKANGYRTLAGAIGEGGIPDAAVVFYSGRNLLARLPENNLVLKKYGTPGLVKGLIYRWLRTSKCMRAYHNALELDRLGILTPQPAFAIECFSSTSALKRSYYACADFDGWNELRGLEKRPDFAAIAPELAAFILDIHTKKVWMKDMSPGNILFRLRADGSGYDFALVDINRMRFGVTDGKRLIEAFRCLLDTEDGTAVVAEAYFGLKRSRGIGLAKYENIDYVRSLYRNFRDRKKRWHKFKRLIGLKQH